MENFIKEYMVGEKPLVKVVNIMGVKMLDVEWANMWDGGKSERTRFLRELKNAGYVSYMGSTFYFIPTY
jgi:hypothetical protein